MTTLKIVRRWGSALPGETITVDDKAQADWLLFNHFAERPGQLEAATAGAVAPGTDGPDILAGGDHTRRFPATRRSPRRDNQALPVAGSPVQYNAGIAPVASGGQQEAPNSEESGASDKPSSKVSGSGRRRAPAS